jgi:phytoene desaturase
MYQVIEALISLCKQYKVSIVTNEPVKKIEITDGRASNVITTKKRYEADAVVVNADYAYAEMNFLEKKWQSYSEKFWGKQTLSPSSILVYIGLNKKIKTKAHHYLYFDRSWEQHFDDVYVNKILPEHPSYYVNTPTHTDPSLAPPGKDMLIFLIPVAAGLSNTQQEYQDLADKTICHFEKTINQSFIKDIEIKEYFSPIDFEKSYNAYKGSAFGIAHTLFQTGPFRPRNKSKKVSNLYYVGQYTNPGIGLPICIISAQIVARLIEKYEA